MGWFIVSRMAGDSTGIARPLDSEITGAPDVVVVFSCCDVMMQMPLSSSTFFRALAVMRLHSAVQLQVRLNYKASGALVIYS